MIAVGLCFVGSNGSQHEKFLEVLVVAEGRRFKISRASAFDTLLGFRGVVFSTATEWGLGLELRSGGVPWATMGW